MVEPVPRTRVAYILKVFPRVSETFILNEILELQRQGVDVEIFSLRAPTEPRFHAPLAELEADVTYLPLPRPGVIWPAIQSELKSVPLPATSIGEAVQYCLRSANPEELKNLLQALLLVGHLRRRGIEHVHAHFATAATRVTLLAHLLSGLRFSFTAHAKDIYHRKADYSLIRDALLRCAFAVTVTDFNLGRLQELAPSAASRIHRIYNGTRLDHLKPVEENPTGAPLIVGVGRLVEKKGFSYLLEACRLLLDRGTDFRCRVVGGGEQRGRLRKQIERLNLGEVVSLVGACSHERVIEELSRCRLAVLPCIVGKDGNRDALPTVLLEAMSLGKPVVSTDLEGVNEIVESGETGLCVPQKDSSALAEAMERLLVDPTLAVSLGKRGREKAERLFDLKHNVGLLRNLIISSPRPVSEQIRSPLERCV